VNPHLASTQAANRRGIAYLCAAMVFFVLNDALMKQVGQSLAVTQMIFVRGLMTLALLLAVAHATGATARRARLADRPLLARAALDALGTVLYLVSLMHLPLANATAINLAAPLIMALAAVLLLRERAGLPRWLAIGAGFVGVLLVIQPRAEGFNAWALVCLAATFAHVARELLTRRIDPAVPSILVTLGSAIAVLLTAALLLPLEGWQPLHALQLGQLALAAALLAGGYFCVVNSMRHGEMSAVAPFRYVGLLVAVLLGWLVWREVPNALAWGGMALMVGSGLFLMLEGRRRAAAPPGA
jgi:drug/metabolite transporter (DMT)-like permease